VYAALREHLRTGRIARGVALQEAALAAQLGVSRTPVREALARLASEGLVIADGRTFAGPELSAADVEEIYALRFLLEPEALRLIAKLSPGRGALSPLKKALEDMAAAHEAADNGGFMDANSSFREMDGTLAQPAPCECHRSVRRPHALPAPGHTARPGRARRRHEAPQAPAAALNAGNELPLQK